MDTESIGMRFSTVLFIGLCGCSAEPFCDTQDIFPGMWSGRADLKEYLFGDPLIEIHSELHIQLFEQKRGYVTGWFYHTEGEYVVQDKYPLYPCAPYALEGEVQDDGDGVFYAPCLVELGDSGACLEVEGDQDGVLLSVSNILGSIEVPLERYEQIDSSDNVFHCLE